MATDKLVDFDHVTDYISREAAIALTDQHCFETSYDAVWMEEELRQLPTADVRPVVHGAWKPNPRNPYWLDCTVCGYGKPERMVYNFCPNCGADCREPNLDTTKGEDYD